MTSPVTYLDHAATTPLLPEVLAAMTGQLGRVGNASSLHASGRAARRGGAQARGGRGRGRGGRAPGGGGRGRWVPARRRCCSPAAAPRATTSPSRGCSGPVGRPTA